MRVILFSLGENFEREMFRNAYLSNTPYEYRFTMFERMRQSGIFFFNQVSMIRANDANGFSALSGRVKISSLIYTKQGRFDSHCFKEMR